MKSTSLFNVKNFNQQRRNLLQLVFSKFNKVIELSDKEKFHGILNCEGIDVMNAPQKFLHDNLP
jgi:hypothetical protein